MSLINYMKKKNKNVTDAEKEDDSLKILVQMSINIKTKAYTLTGNQRDTYLPANSSVASQLQKYELLLKMNLLLLQLDFHKLNGHL